MTNGREFEPDYDKYRERLRRARERDIFGSATHKKEKQDKEVEGE